MLSVKPIGKIYIAVAKPPTIKAEKIANILVVGVL